MQNAGLNEHTLNILNDDRKYLALTVEISDCQLGLRPHIEFPTSIEGRIVNRGTTSLNALKQKCPITATLEGRSYSVVEVAMDGVFKAVKDGDW